MLKIGDRAPEFTLPDDTGADRSLSDFLTAGPLVLYFYPADFTPGCTRQACSLRDLSTTLVDAGLRIVGVSPQDPASHAKFRAQYRLPFPLLSDEHKEVVKMYDLDGPLGFGVRRGTYLIDPAKRILGALLADFSIARHERFVRDAIASSTRAAGRSP